VPIWNIVAEVRYYQAQLGINAGTANKLAAFASLINEFSLRLYVDDAYQLAYEVANKSGIIQDLNPEANFENISRHENVLELLNGIQDFVDSYSAEGETMTMMQYLENVSLMTGDEKEDDESTNKVSLMTVHSSKGLEYNNIYIVGMEEELFPSSMSSGSQKEIEEERRLFYVAVTRAREKVHLSFAEQRYKWGNLQSSSPSRFLKDIDPKYVAKNYKEYNERDEDSGFGGFDTIERNSFASDDRKPAFQPRKLMQVRQAVQRPALEVLDDIANPNDIREGMSVMHARFGIGKVVAIEGAMPEAKAMVDFEGQGQKQLLLKFAKLKIMN